MEGRWSRSGAERAEGMLNMDFFHCCSHLLTCFVYEMLTVCVHVLACVGVQLVLTGCANACMSQHFCSSFYISVIVLRRGQVAQL